MTSDCKFKKMIIIYVMRAPRFHASVLQCWTFRASLLCSAHFDLSTLWKISLRYVLIYTLMRHCTATSNFLGCNYPFFLELLHSSVTKNIQVILSVYIYKLCSSRYQMHASPKTSIIICIYYMYTGVLLLKLCRPLHNIQIF